MYGFLNYGVCIYLSSLKKERKKEVFFTIKLQSSLKGT